MERTLKYLINKAFFMRREDLLGWAQGFDPLPYAYYQSFIEDDEEALWDDMDVVASDLEKVLTWTDHGDGRTTS